MNRRPIVLLVAIVAVLWIGSANYGRAIYAVFGQEPPPEWSAALLELRHGELLQKFGNPTGMPEKGFQYWEKHYWWGRHVLQVGYLDCCTSLSKPEEIYVLTYVKGKYDAVDITVYARPNMPK